jgi:hypothetical protein
MKPTHIEKFGKIGGIALNNALKGDQVTLWCKGTIKSTEPHFVKFITNLTSGIFSKANIIEDGIVQFVILQHKDLSIDIWVNEIDKFVEARTKRPVKKGQVLYNNDIADISRLKFSSDIPIRDEDNIMVCFKIKWTFCLYFDLTRHEVPQNIDKLHLALGEAYKKTTYDLLFSMFANKPKTDEMLNDGWFPYIELIGHEYERLLTAHIANFAIENVENNIISSFDRARIERISSKWWNNKTFRDQKSILEAGLNSLCKNDTAGDILAVKVFYTEAEGIIRNSFFNDKGSDAERKTNILFEYMENKATLKVGTESSMFFQAKFAEFLKNIVYKGFDLKNGILDLSRHTVSHGVAKSKDYSRTKAIQGLLMLDQLYFYLS